MKTLLILMAQLVMWDGLVTQTFVTSGLAKEGNPLMAPFVNQGSFLLLKLVGLVICMILLWLIHKRFPKLAITTASSVSAFYIVVLAWNFSTLFGI